MGTERSIDVRDARIRRYVGRLGIIGTTAAGALAAGADGAPVLAAVCAVVALASLGDVEFLAIRHGGDGNAFNCSEAVLMGALVFVGPWAPIAGSVGVFAHQVVSRRAPTKRWFNTASYAVASSTATAVFLGVGALGPPAFVALGVAAITYYVVNLGTVVQVIAHATGERRGVVVRRSLVLSAVVASGNASIAIVVSLIAVDQPVVLITVPLLVIQLLLSYRNTRAVTSERDVWARLQDVSSDLIRVAPGDVGTRVIGAAVELLHATEAELILRTPEGAAAWSCTHEGVSRQTVGSIEELAGDHWALVDEQRATVAVAVDTRRGLRSSLLVQPSQDEHLLAPLEVGDDLVGMLRIRTDRLVNDPTRALSVLANLASQTSAALANERLVHELRHAADHDALTGLPNRTRLLAELDDALHRSRRSGGAVAVLFFDLDRFKVINDSLGHHFGDQLLTAVAERFRSAIRDGDLVARFGGDEFIVVTPSSPAAADALATRLVAVLDDPVDVGGRPTALSMTVGIAIDDGTGDAGSLLRDADAAMYAAKADGPGSVRTFTADMRLAAIDRLELDTELRKALDAREIEAVFQPIVDLTTGAIVELEALARWTHARLGPVSPADFIPVAEESGQIRRLGAAVLEQACRRLRAWQELGLGGPGLRVAVNVSAVQIDELLPSIVADTLRRTGLPAECLTLEVTESALVAGPDAVRTLTALRHLGVSIALDDFGTGFSSLSTLRDLPVETLKIDRSFIARMGSPADDAMVRGILGLADALGLTVVAEGIETADVAARLRSFGCARGQGWHFGRPVDEPLVDRSLSGEAEVVPIRGRRASA